MFKMLVILLGPLFFLKDKLVQERKNKEQNSHEIAFGCDIFMIHHIFLFLII
jgi:hypothetical protein